MSQTGKSVLNGLKSVGGIAAKKTTLMKLTSQLKAATQAIGRAAHERKIACGAPSQEAARTHADLEAAKQRVAKAKEAMKAAPGVKQKAVSAKDFATAETALKMAEMKVSSAHEALGAYILANTLQVPGAEQDIASVRKLQEQIDGLNAEVGKLGHGLLKNKVGIAAVACVVLVVCGVGWYVVSSMSDGSLSAPALHAAFASNPKRASEKYKGKIITLQGTTIVPMTIDVGDAALGLLTDDKDYRVFCYFNGRTGNVLDVIQVPKGTQVVIQGRCSGTSPHGDVTLEDSVLVQVAGKRVSPSRAADRNMGPAERFTQDEVIELLKWHGATIGHTVTEDGITKTAVVFRASQEEWRRLLGEEEILSEGYDSFGHMNYSRWRYRCKDGPLTFHGELLLGRTGGTMYSLKACFY